MKPLIRVFVLVSALFTLTVSIPADPRDTLRLQTLSLPPPPTYSPHSRATPWRRFRDAIVHSIWGPSPSQKVSTSLGADPLAVRAKYGGELVLRFEVKTPEEVHALAEAANTLYLDIWETADDWVDIRVAKSTVEPLLSLLPGSLHNAHSPLVHDLAQAVVDTYPADSSFHSDLSQYNALKDVTIPSTSPPLSTIGDVFFEDYQPLSVIVPWMRLMASLFPGHVHLISTGASYEGRDLSALRIGTSSYNESEPNKRRETIVISGGSHAREWISTSAVNYVAHALATQYGKSRVVTKLVDEFDWIFVPTLNPDGYEYTWTQDRLWRKNRQHTSISFCPGIDLARSYDFGWDGDANVNNPCLENYAGVGPFEATEAQQFARWVKNQTENNHVEISAFLDLHSYSQDVLYPYSFSCDQLPPTLENLEELGLSLAKAIRLTHGRLYQVMSACQGSTVASGKSASDVWPKMEPNGGSALDWFYHQLQVKYAYQIKLRDTGNYGFLLPSNEIAPTGQEMFSAALELGDFLLSNKGIEMTAN